ncbi:transposase ISSpo9 [Comamonas testosteroni]|uniref:Transposase ISSpo9 n=1 Tax=Comamonas testosteroni TaxID=285 RepID=A0A096F8W7_COMTE|nr:transposase ISSpo9 [Comamonas testosteroni]
MDKGMSWFAAISGKRGRSPQFSDAAIQFCLTIKNLFGLALRQTIGFVQSLLALSELPRPVPDFSTLCRRQRSLDVQVACRPSSGGLELLLDSTGTKFLGEGEWKCKKHGAERRRQWRKLHIGIDAQTLPSSPP